MTKALGVFVSSSDNTRDVFLAVSKAFALFWGECNCQFYVGLNSKPNQPLAGGFIPVFAPVSGWRQELACQIQQLQHDYILLLLDDFLITSPVDETRLFSLLQMAQKFNLPYLRLIEIDRSWIVKKLAWLIAKLQGQSLAVLPENIPYYSSLQVAIWNRTHLIDMLTGLPEGSIWAFEHQRIPDKTHHAIVEAPPIVYKHVVEKGKWMPFTQLLFTRIGLTFDPGSRAIWKGGNMLWNWKGRFVFPIVGYAWVNLKNWFRSLCLHK